MEDAELQRHLGHTARLARERLGLTQSQAARQAELVPGVFGRIERGGMMPSVPSLRRVCLALAISADTLLSLDRSQVAESLEAPPPPPSIPESKPELDRIVRMLSTWTPEQLQVLARVISVLEPSLHR